MDFGFQKLIWAGDIAGKAIAIINQPKVVAGLPAFWFYLT